MIARLRQSISVKRIGRFGLTGALVTAIHVAIALTAIHAFGAPQGIANAIAFSIATVASYVLHSLWSFEHEIGTGTLARYSAVTALGFAISWTIGAISEHADAPPLLGIACIVLVVPGISFVLHSVWTYGHTPAPRR